jgi:hypothetical protein
LRRRRFGYYYEDVVPVEFAFRRPGGQ